MVAGCANAILQYGHMGPDPAPVIGDNWAPRFLERHPEYFIKKQQTIDANRKNAHCHGSGSRFKYYLSNGQDPRAN